MLPIVIHLVLRYVTLRYVAWRRSSFYHFFQQVLLEPQMKTAEQELFCFAESTLLKSDLILSTTKKQI